MFFISDMLHDCNRSIENIFKFDKQMFLTFAAKFVAERKIFAVLRNAVYLTVLN